MKRQIPNIITSLNLLSGCLAILEIAEGDLITGALFILLGAFFDFFDGLVARLLQVKSKLGAELDSLADVVTFGVVPAYLVYTILEAYNLPGFLPYLAFLLAIFSALRLAKFNLDQRQVSTFIGLPTPANALFWASLPLTQFQFDSGYCLIPLHMMEEMLFNPYILLLIIVLFSYLLIAEVPLMSLKFKSFSWKKNKFRYLLVLTSLALLIVLYFAAIPFILLLYFAFSYIKNTSINI